MTTPLIVAENIEKTYPLRGQTITALAPTSFEIHPDTTVAVVGPSGTGKSTLAAILARWEQPTNGDIHHPQGIPTVAFVPQRPPLFDTLTVADNIKLAAPKRTHRLSDTAAQLGIDHLLDRYPNEASLGEQQRIATARAIHAQPQLLVLDEPSSHQDAHTTQLLLTTIMTPPQDTAIIYTTHDPKLTETTPHQIKLTKPAPNPDR